MRVEPSEFRKVLQLGGELVVVTASGGFFSAAFQYLTSYKGLAFFCKSDEPITLPRECEVITARKIWIP